MTCRLQFCAHKKQRIMESNQKLELINGQYTPTDAREVLLALINHKINFNNMAAFSAEERTNESVEHYRKRVKQLQELREAVINLIEEAAAGGYDLRINGSFGVTLVEQPAKAVVAEEVKAKVSREPELYLA